MPEKRDVTCFPFFQESVFDKGSANTYYEELILNKMASSFLRDLTEQSSQLFLLTFDDDHCKWLFDKTNISGSSLFEFLNNYESSIENCDSLLRLLPYKPFENKRLLQNLKLQNLHNLNL